MPNSDEKSDRDLLVETNVIVKSLAEEMNLPGRRIARIEDKIDDHAKDDSSRFAEHERQLNLWRGALALLAFILIVFGATLATHILGGK